jgi:hypothetical protein
VTAREAELIELRNELKLRNVAFNDLERRHEELKAYFALAAEQLDGLAERPALESFRPSESEARARIIAAERLVYEFLIGFSDDVASIADRPDAVLFVTKVRELFATVLEQLEAANDELAIVTERLARRNRYPGGRLLGRVSRSRTLRRLRSFVGRRLAGLRAGG